jgi:hypothetical protein
MRASAFGVPCSPFPFRGIAERFHLDNTRKILYTTKDKAKATKGSSTRQARAQRRDGRCKSPPGRVEVVPELSA